MEEFLRFSLWQTSGLPCLRDWVQILHIKIGETEVDVSMQASILAVESSVDQLGNELAGEGNNEGVGDDRDPSKMICLCRRGMIICFTCRESP